MAEEFEFEYDVKTIPVKSTEQYQGEVDKLQAEGWVLVQGILPVTIYHVMRPKVRLPQPDMGGGLGVIHIDDSKVMILRKDGTIDRGAAPE